MLKISNEILLDYKSLLIGVIYIKNADNSKSVPQVGEMLKSEEQKLRSRNVESISEFPNILAWQNVHKKFGNKPKRYAPSVQAVVKRVIKGGGIPRINTLVDLYNYISLKYILPVGGEDQDKCKGNIVLDYAKGDETFIEIGGKENNPPEEGEVVYRDDKGIICRKFNWREADRTKLTKNTKNAVIVIESVPPTTKKVLEEAITELKELVSMFCGGEVKTEILGKDSD